MTNLTFTDEAKELAEATRVLLRDDSKINDMAK